MGEGSADTGHQAGPDDPGDADPAASQAASFRLMPGRRLNRLQPLPVPLTSLVGRDSDIAAVVARFRAGPRLVTLTGPGGIGKTRLALGIAETLRGEVDGLCFVDLAAISDVSFVGPAVARAVGAREIGDQSLPERLAGFLDDERLLMVLDNFEQVVTAGLFVAELLAVCRRLMVLVTSRIPLRISGEQEYPVPPLAQPHRGSGSALAGVQQSAAGRLFVDRARAVDPAFLLDAASAPAVAAICDRLDGLPLAIELAAAHTKVLPPAALLARLDRRLPLLVEGPRDHPVRLQTMRNAIGWSYNLLDADRQFLFRQLAVFAGGFTLDAAEAVIADPSTDVLAGLRVLVDHSLVSPASAGDTPRFAMLEIIREFALEQLREEGDEARARQAHANYFQTLAEHHARERYVPAENGAIERLETDHANVRLALDWLAAQQDDVGFLRMAAALCWFWADHSHFQEGRAWLERALAYPTAEAGAAWPDALMGLGLFVFFQGDDQRAERLYREALARYQEIGHAVGAAYASTSLGALLTYQGRFDEGGDFHYQALSLCRQISDAEVATSIMSGARSNLGMVLHAQGDPAAAAAHFAAAIDGYRALGYTSGLVRVLYLSGCTAMTLADLPGALTYFRESLREAAILGDERILAVSLEGMAAMAAAGGRLRPAALLFGAAAEMRDRIGFHVRYPLDLLVYAAAVQQVSAGLDEAARQGIREEGRRLGVQDVLALAADVALPPPKAATPDRYGLSRRELEVLRGIVARQTDREIAADLAISPRTVGWHVTGILNKLGVDTRRNAARKAVRDEIV